jgi:hypothetical protein
MFNVDFRRLFAILLPVLLRKPKMLALLQVYCWPLVQIYKGFLAYREKNLYTLSHNSQVYSMENVFNDRFDSLQRRIYITDGFSKQRRYAYTRLEDKPIYLGEIPLHNRADYADTGIDFIVWVPVAVMISPQDKIELTALINKYKLASKRFRIYRA